MAEEPKKEPNKSPSAPRKPVAKDAAAADSASASSAKSSPKKGELVPPSPDQPRSPVSRSTPDSASQAPPANPGSAKSTAAQPKDGSVRSTVSNAAKSALKKASGSATVPDPRLAGLKTEDEDEPTWVDELKVEARRSVPAYLGSLVAHLVLIIALALMVFEQVSTPVLDLAAGIAESTPEIDSFESEGFDVSTSDAPPLFDPEAFEVEPPVLALPPMTIRPDAPQIQDPLEALTGTTALSGRETGSREALLAEMGGTSGTEDAVKEGLEWLKRNQGRDGTWSMQGPYLDGANLESRSAATALALLCFLGAGHTHQTGDYQAEVQKGLDVLLERQGFDGDFYQIDGTQSEIPNHHLYTHAMGMLVMCELVAMTGDEKYRESAIKAVKFAEKYQAPEGGWRYTLGVDSDLSVTGWFVIALQSARMAGIEVQPTTWEGIDKFLYRVMAEDRIRFCYKRNAEPTLAMTVEGLLCRQYLGWTKSDQQLQDGIAYLRGHPINFNEKDYYYWYYAAQAMHNMEGDAWTEWNQVMREQIPANQIRSGRERGSWTPEGDRYSMSGGGRLYSTALMILTLEVYYRHLPLYRYRLE